MTSELESYKKRCLELEKKSENDEKRCLMLEVEVEDLKNKNMKIREVVEVRDGEDEVEKLYELMAKMKVLEREKQKAESEVRELKEKVNELMSRVKLESDINEKAKQGVNVVSRFSSKVRKRLPFEDDGCSSKKMAPSKNKEDTSRVDNKTVSLQGTGSSEDEDANDDVEGSKSEEESLSEFINDSPKTHFESKSTCESSDNFEEPKNVLNDFKETADNNSRRKISNFKWNSRGEMQADFCGDPELCMRAVCALYRQQTEDEKALKVTIYLNGRGFNQLDAPRGSDLAEFLMDGDPAGDLKKTVEDLKLYDKNGIEDCRRFATYYSKQLFEIYYNKEDPYFP